MRHLIVVLGVVSGALRAGEPSPALDGAHRRGRDGVPSFIEVGARTDDELHALLMTSSPG